jgi:flagellin
MIMALRIQNNVAAFNAHRQLNATAAAQSKAMEKLSSGYRINRAADDAAGLAISEKMRAQIGGLDQAQRNAQDGVSLVQTGEGALNEVHSMLQRMRDLKVQYENGTLDTDDKSAIVAEAQQLSSEINDISDKTQFNGINLLKGDASGNDKDITFQVGANAGETITVTAQNLMGASGNGGVGDDFGTLADASGTGTAAVASATAAWGNISLDDIDDAIQNVSTLRSNFGAVQNRLEHRLNNLATYEENLTASESQIRDVDMASEMVNYTKLGILQQAGTAMLAQANQSSQSVLSLLQ